MLLTNSVILFYMESWTLLQNITVFRYFCFRNFSFCVRIWLFEYRELTVINIITTEILKEVKLCITNKVWGVPKRHSLAWITARFFEWECGGCIVVKCKRTQKLIIIKLWREVVDIVQLQKVIFFCKKIEQLSIDVAFQKGQRLKSIDWYGNQ